jgi:hypothetical protein
MTTPRLLRRHRVVASAFVVTATALPLGQTASPSYDTARVAAVKACEAISAKDYQSGLAFNPDGYRSYYVRAECLQRTAVQFRDLALCDGVKQRRALLWSSWGYSPANCRTLVGRAVDADRAEIEEARRRYLAGSMVLRDFRIERNGNGRDYDVMPSFTGTEGHGYTIAIEIIPTGGSPIAVHANGYYVDPRSELRLFIRQQEIKARFPTFESGRSYTVRVTATFTLPASAGSRSMSDTFLEGLFPLRERTRTITHDSRF